MIHPIHTILFVYAKDGEVRCIRADDPVPGDGWTHTATIDPAVWIPAMLSADPYTRDDMLDELTWGPGPCEP